MSVVDAVATSVVMYSGGVPAFISFMKASQRSYQRFNNIIFCLYNGNISSSPGGVIRLSLFSPLQGTSSMNQDHLIQTIHRSLTFSLSPCLCLCSSLSFSLSLSISFCLPLFIFLFVSVSLCLALYLCLCVFLCLCLCLCLCLESRPKSPLDKIPPG